MNKHILTIVIIFQVLVTAQNSVPKMQVWQNGMQVGTFDVNENLKLTFNSANTYSTLFTENFENGNLAPWQYRVTSPVITSLAYSSPTHSMTLPPGRQDYSCIYRKLTDSLYSGTVGLEFKIMKKDSTQNKAFYGMLYQKRDGSPSYSKIQMVVGITSGTAKDSIGIQTWNWTTPNMSIYDKRVKKIIPLKWYKVNIEYNFATKTCSYFIDDEKVGEHVYEILYFDSILFGDQDSDGADIGNSYFLDDIVVYKKQ